jgi:DNA repair protein RecO (recombination protein O)
MLIKTKGIVFRTVKYGETSLIVDIYTQEKGLQTYLLGSVRTKKPRFSAGATQPSALVNLVAYAREGKEINHIKEITPAYVYSDIPFDFKKGAVALFMTELVSKTIREVEPNELLFNFIWDAFLFLDSTKQSFANVHLIFALQLTQFLGFMPHSNEENTAEAIFFDLKEGVFSTKPPAHSFYIANDIANYFNTIIQTPIKESSTITMPRTLRYELLEKMIQYYRIHIENLTDLQSHHVLREVMDGL